jgi:hypothetical protein
MEIMYLGQASFQCKGERVVDVNPLQKPARGTIALYSTRQNRPQLVVDGPGEYEIGGVLIATVQAGSKDSGLLVHSITMGNLNLVHLTASGNDLSERALEDLGKVDVLLVQADEVAETQVAIQKLEPRVVIPFGSQAMELCAALGVSQPRTETRFSWNGTTNVPKAVLLKPSGAKRRAA